MGGGGGGGSPPRPPKLEAPIFSMVDLEKLGSLLNLDLRELSDYTDAYPSFLRQQDQFENLGKFASAANEQTRQSLEEVTPGLLEGLKSVGALTESQLAGRIPQDVEDEILRIGAFRDFGSGIGSQSGLARNLTGRDFGLNSMALQERGLQNLESSLRASAALSPVQATDLLFSPADVLARMDANTSIENQEQSFNTNLSNFRTTYNNDLENQERYYNTNTKNNQESARVNAANTNAMNQYNYDLMKYQMDQQRSSSGLGSLFGGLFGGALGFAAGGPGGALAGLGLGGSLGGGIESAASGGGFQPLATGLTSGFANMASIGVNDQNPYGMLSALSRSLGLNDGTTVTPSGTPIPRAQGINQSPNDSRLPFVPPAGSGRLPVRQTQASPTI